MTATKTNAYGFTVLNVSRYSWKVPEGRSFFESSRKYGIRRADGLFASADGVEPMAWNQKYIPQEIIDTLCEHPDAWSWIELREL